MIAALVVFQLVVPITYADVPAEVERVSVLQWRDDRAPAPMAADIERNGGQVIARVAIPARVLVLFTRADDRYMVDGPFEWPRAATDRVLDRRWRRTRDGTTPAGQPHTNPLEWLSPDGPGEWPRCFWTGQHQWGCWGAPVAQAGVLISRARDRLWWTVVSASGPPEMRSSSWGRLLIVSDESGDASKLRVTFARVVASSQRPRSARLDTAAWPRAHAVSVAAGSAWLFGDEVAADAWMEVRSARGGPQYLSVSDVVDADPALPLMVALNATRDVDGVVVGGRDEPAPGALVSIFRAIEPLATPNDSKRTVPRRVLVEETYADGSGVFHLGGIGEADYELVAWHPQGGRAIVALPRSSLPGALTVRLHSPPLVRGRVVSGGRPLEGVPVVSVPDPQAIRDAIDPIDLKGGDARTGVDGRFVVSQSAAGGGELRVGGAPYAVRRLSLPRVPSPLIDLGDVDLGTPIVVTIALDQDPGCDLRAAGPVGQTGLQVVSGQRSGPGLFRLALPEAGMWELGLACGRVERALSPSVVSIDAARAGQEVRVMVR
jgi:hypothetical protein